jgi:hypothetical protein
MPGWIKVSLQVSPAPELVHDAFQLLAVNIHQNSRQGWQTPWPRRRPGLLNGSNSLDSLPVGRVLPGVPGIAFGWQSSPLVYRKAWGSGNLAGALVDGTSLLVDYVFNRLGDL